MGSTINFLDLDITINDNQLHTKVYHKPSYDLYFLPYNSVHPLHMKKNVPYAMLYRTIKYCSTFDAFITEREYIRTALLLNKYPAHFIDTEFARLLKKFNVQHPLTRYNYNEMRQDIIDSPVKEKITFDYGKTMFVHFTYCENMKTFPGKFHNIWNKYFGESPINDIKPILGTRNANNLQLQLVKNE
ncbi:unnamed protein product [Adineta steineri]|uniref:Helix-turn-helix domain-containing protein n=1 Tax=Adineta steineri TaxID=433720 RepID=A0A819NB08_9BILA|nr:unnamed protein product [Adineta steineri]CAF3995826.1 unnamed protein product [Adineta steineri]